MSKTLLRHTLIKKYFWHFCWLPYLYTFSLFENASFIIVSPETEYISTRSWYRNINYKEVNKNVKNIFLSMCDVKLFLTFTSLNLVLLWQLFYLFCSSIVINTVIVTTGFGTRWNKGNNKITELRTILQRESPNS
jgi:hypothetical protein